MEEVCIGKALSEIVSKNQASRNPTKFARCCLTFFSSKNHPNLKTHNKAKITTFGNFVGHRNQLPTDPAQIEELLLKKIAHTRFKLKDFNIDKSHQEGQALKENKELKLQLGKLKSRLRELESKETQWKDQKSDLIDQLVELARENKQLKSIQKEQANLEKPKNLPEIDEHESMLESRSLCSLN